MWMHNINSKRKQFGEFHHVFPDVFHDRKKFMKCFRMTLEIFFELLHMIKPLIEKHTTKFRETISPEERLAAECRATPKSS
nr:unnamed protein product [Callosobruchus analis]